jgi:hypothetical protein
MIHGEEVQTVGKAWGLNGAETTGAMSGAVLSPVGGFLMFGTCSAAPQSRVDVAFDSLSVGGRCTILPVPLS